MRKIKFAIYIFVIFSLVLLLCNTSNNVVDVHAITIDNVNEVYKAPTTNPYDKTLQIVRDISFNPGTYDWIENDDWDWDTLASSYGATKGANPQMEIVPPGANNHASFEFWAPALELTGVNGFMFYVDYSNLINATNIRMYMRFRTSTNAPVGAVSLLDDRYLNAFADCYYYDYSEGKWIVTKTESDSFFRLPDNFKGYVYMPIINYNDIHTNGVGNSNLYLQMYHFDMSVDNNEENVNPIYLDSIQAVKELTEHTHEYVLKGTLKATCTHQGLDLLACTCGQVKWSNLADKVEHLVGNKYYCSENLASALCETCNELVYFNEEVTDKWDDAVKVTYHYNHEECTSKTYEYPKGYTLNKKDVPWIFQVNIGYDTWQFFRITTDEVGLYGKNPIGLKVEEDLELYSQYNNTYADQKYRAMISDVSFNGGVYDEETYKEQVIFVGQSNFSLWHGMENWYRGYGVPVRNNSVAGATSHNYVEFVEELVLIYKPKIVVCIVSSNDLAYHQMSEKTVMNNMIAFYDKVVENLPGTQVIFVSGNPLPGRNEYFKVIERINDKLDSFCETKDDAYFVDIYDITMQYVLQYPIGWDTWTHLHQEELTNVMGVEVYKVMKEVIKEKNIVFK